MKCGLKEKPEECKVDVGNYVTLGFVLGVSFGLVVGMVI